MQKQTTLFAFWLLLLSPLSEGRVFDFAKNAGAPYFAGSYGGSQLGSNPFINESQYSLTSESKTTILSSGELGFLYSTPSMNFLIGLELMSPQKTQSIQVSNATDALYTASSLIQGIVYKMGIEGHLRKTNQSRSFLGAQYGLLNVTQKNSYALTSAGQTAYPGLADHTTESSGAGTLYAIYVGHEAIFSDTVSLFFNMGYREAKVNSLKYTQAVATYTGSKNSGDEVKDSSGRVANLDFSGAFLQLGFRFYF